MDSSDTVRKGEGGLITAGGQESPEPHSDFGVG